MYVGHLLLCALILFILSPSSFGEDVFLLSAESQSEQSREFIHCSKAIGKWHVSNITTDSARWAPRFIEMYPTIGLVVLSGPRGETNGSIIIRSVYFPQLSRSFTTPNAIPLGSQICKNSGGEYVFSHAFTTESNEGISVGYSLLLISDDHSVSREIFQDLDFSGMINLGSTIQQGLPSTIQIWPSGDSFVEKIGPKQKEYKIKLHIPGLVRDFAASKDVDGPIYLSAHNSEMSIFVFRKKDGEKLLMCDIPGRDSPVILTRKNDIGGLRIIRDWVYIQDDLPDGLTSISSTRRLRHLFWRPTDGKTLDIELTGDVEVLDIFESKRVLFRQGSKVFIGKFDLEDRGPIASEIVYESSNSTSVHWGMIKSGN